MSVAVSDTPTPLLVTSSAAASVTKSGSDCNTNANNGKNLVFISPDISQEIKSEPPEDINDGQPQMEQIIEEKPGKIRLTPTINLMPTPNPTNPKRKFVCPYENCTKSYGKSSHLRSHLTWHTGIKPFVCQVANCGKGFTRSDELNRHFRTHTGEKPFECIQCSKKFSRSDHLTKHLATHSKQMMNNTKKPRLQPSNRRVHQFSNVGIQYKIPLPGSCDGDKAVPDFESRNMSASKDLTKDSYQCISPIKIKVERPDNAEECHVASQPSDMADQTASSDSEEEIPNEIIVPASSLLYPPLLTNKSGQTYSNSVTENNAQRATDKSNTRLKQFYKDAPGIAYESDRPFPCNQCPKSFKRHDDLTRHLRTHTGEKPFACGECERRFMRSDHLQKHLKTHTKLR